MTDVTNPRFSSGEPHGGTEDTETARDLRALAATTTHHVPTLAVAASGARRRLAPATWKESLMSVIHALQNRPGPVTAAAVLALALLASFVPVSYERTTGHDVTLTVSGLGADQVANVARQLEAVLGADGVTVQTTDPSAGFTMRAFVPARTGGSAAALARAFADDLAARGYAASAEAAPRKERVSSPIYAYAMQQVIEIRTDGKSAAELEAEIRQRLAEAGVTDASVSVTDEAGGGRKIAVEMRHRNPGDPASGQPAVEIPDLVLTRDGAPLGANGCTVKIEKKRTDAGLTLTVEVTDAGRLARVEIPQADTRSDAEIAAAIEAELRRAGIQARVTVTGGEIKVEKVE
jgi:hypothetical protein